MAETGREAVVTKHGRHEAGAESPALVLNEDEERVVRALLAALRRIRHGSIQVMVQDSRVVQIDTLEKTRFARSASS